MNSLAGKVLAITGGSGLLGREIVDYLKKCSAKVFNLDINHSSEDSYNIKADVTDEVSVRNAIDSIVARHGRIDGWINNAYPRTADWGANVEEVKMESWRKNVDLQLNAYFMCCKCVLEAMKKQQSGSIVNMSSIYGIVAPDFQVYKNTQMTMPVAYSAIKAGIINFTKYLAAYYGPHNIRVNSVSPGGIFDGQPKVFVEQYEEKVPLRRMGKPTDIAPAVAFLISDDSSYVTGHNLVVDGGWTAI